MSRELLPCPFCGQQDAFVEQLDSDASVVICQGHVGGHSACLARGPVGVQESDDEDQPGRNAAVREWNARAQSADQQGEPYAVYQWRPVSKDSGEPLLSGSWHNCGKGEYHRMLNNADESTFNYAVRRLVADQPATAKVDERAEFEKWFLANVETDEGLTLERSAARPEEYELDETAQLYRGWQARAKLNTPQ
ncbi:Lar family restriction alleviation protein [Pseudomonas amygdali]|uniref:Lar family restriction alleviation protein n=1 Tax=Pseudomonas amygdali TaxID=47877 RepID=UPI001604FECD|nr:Lar family restriction alleviation protein [Pseudomonas amygdali]